MDTQLYWLGLDAGGTGSTFVVVDGHINETIRLTGGAIQARRMPLEQQMEAIAGFVEPVLRDLGEEAVGGFGLGIAGAGRPKERDELERALRERWPRLRAVVRPDSEVAHIGAFGGSDGILVITGTGSIVWGRLKGEWHRAGGFGYLIGDEGSGMRLGLEGLAAAGHAWDGGTPTLLCELLAERHGIDNASAMIIAVYEEGFQASRTAATVLEAAQAGDQPCAAIVERQAGLLAAQIGLVARRFPEGDRKVVLWGGLQKNAFYRERLADHILRQVGPTTLMDPLHEPCIGATLLAQTVFGAKQ